jgi:hypothetical protein
MYMYTYKHNECIYIYMYIDMPQKGVFYYISNTVCLYIKNYNSIFLYIENCSLGEVLTTYKG